MKTLKSFACLVLGAGIALFGVCEVGAQSEPTAERVAQPTPLPPARPVEFEYAVKFVCGRSATPGPGGGIVAPGPYFTAINIHNPSLRQAATFRHKVVVAYPNLKPGPIVWRAPATLRPDEAAEIDCPEILASVAPAQAFLKGFVVLLSPVELDVVAVYTAGQPMVATLHTERVPARTATPCGDLALDLSTGVANWTVQGPGIPATVTATAVTPVHSAWSTLQSYPAAKWVSLSTTGTTPAPATYTFRTCFCLCSGYERPDLALEVLADNEVRVFLNGTPAAGIAFKAANAYTAPPAREIATAESFLLPGENCLTAEVRELHSQTPMGLILGGGLKAKGGACGR